MRLLDAYLLRELLVPLFYCLVGFQVFWTAFDLYSHLDEYRELNLGVADVAHLYILKMPELLGTVLPVALLLALLYTLTNLSRHNEIVAMRTAGLSLVRISRPFLLVGVLMSVLLFLVTEYFGPRAAERMAEIQTRQAASEEESPWVDRVIVRKDHQGNIQTLGPLSFNRKTQELRDVVAELNSTARDRDLYLPDTNRVVNSAENVSRGEWTPRGWLFHNVNHFKYQRGSSLWPNPEQSVFHEMILVTNLNISPTEILTEVERKRIQVRLSSHDAGKRLLFTVRELLEFTNGQKAPSPGTKEYSMVHTQLHGRLAQPLTCVVVVLIALPFGAFLGRRSAFVGVAASVVMCFAYFMLFRLGMAMGMGGALAAMGIWGPLVAAWLPNFSFATIGLGLSWKMR